MSRQGWRRNPERSAPHAYWHHDPELDSLLAETPPKEVVHWTDINDPWTVSEYLLIPAWSSADSGRFRLYSLIQQRGVLSVRDITTGWGWLSSDPTFTRGSITEVQERLLTELAGYELP